MPFRRCQSTADKQRIEGFLMIQAPKVDLIHVFLGMFGPPAETQGLGQCLIILAPEFNREWERTLSNQGFSWLYDDLDGYPAVFIPLKPSLEVSR